MTMGLICGVIAVCLFVASFLWAWISDDEPAAKFPEIVSGVYAILGLAVTVLAALTIAGVA